MKAVYCVTRKDLPIIHQAVQAGHACLMAGKEFPKQDYEETFLIYLHAENQEDMRGIMSGLVREGVKFVSFHEPDFDRGLTSFATEPIDRYASETLCMLNLMSW